MILKNKKIKLLIYKKILNNFNHKTKIYKINRNKYNKLYNMQRLNLIKLMAVIKHLYSMHHNFKINLINLNLKS